MADWTTAMQNLGDLALYLDPGRGAPHPLDVQQKRAMNPLMQQQQEIQNRTLAEILSQSQQAFPTTLEGAKTALEGAKFGLESQKWAEPWKQAAAAVSVGGPEAMVNFGQQNPEWAQKYFGGRKMTPPGYWEGDTGGADAAGLSSGGQVDVPLNASLNEAGSRFYNMGPETARKITESQGTLSAELAKIFPQLLSNENIASARDNTLLEIAKLHEAGRKADQNRLLKGEALNKFYSRTGPFNVMTTGEQDKAADLLSDTEALTPKLLTASMNRISNKIELMKTEQANMLAEAKSAGLDVNEIHALMQRNIDALDRLHREMQAKKAELEAAAAKPSKLGGALREMGQKVSESRPEWEPPTL